MLNNLMMAASDQLGSTQDLFLALLASLCMGLIVACLYMYRNTYSKNFVVTLALLPAMVQLVIMLVNGNLGVGVAVMGAFSLVRFRSIPGSARDIGSIFFAMAIGLATGVGQVAAAALFLIIVGLMTVILNKLSFGEPKTIEKELKISIPENIDYAGLFDDLFARHTRRWELIKVKTTNMGSLYELSYLIVLKNTTVEKNFLNALRCRNGNLSIICGRPSFSRDEL